MDETEKVKQKLKELLKTWNNDQLHTAFEYCENMSNDTGNVWWMELTETVRQEITDRGGRR